MSGTPMPIRAIPKHGGPDMYFDAAKLTSVQRKNLQDELDKRGFFTQYLFLEDPTHILVEAEIRNRLEAEQETDK